MRSILDGDNDSEYVKAAQQEFRDPFIIKAKLADATYRKLNNEHYLALFEAITNNDPEITAWILLATNQRLNPVNPYDVPGKTRTAVISSLLETALRHAVNPKIILLLLQQQAIRNFLSHAPRDSYVFTMLAQMIDQQQNLNAAYELLEVARSTGQQIPRIMREYPNRAVNTAHNKLLFGYKHLIRSTNQGLEIGYFRQNDNAKVVKQKLPGLPTELIYTILSLALSSEDLANLPINTVTILNAAKPARIKISV